MDDAGALLSALEGARAQAQTRVETFAAVVEGLRDARGDADTDDEHDPEGSTLSWDRATHAASLEESVRAEMMPQGAVVLERCPRTPLPRAGAAQVPGMPVRRTSDGQGPRRAVDPHDAWSDGSRGALPLRVSGFQSGGGGAGRKLPGFQSGGGGAGRKLPGLQSGGGGAGRKPGVRRGPSASCISGAPNSAIDGTPSGSRIVPHRHITRPDRRTLPSPCCERPRA